MVWHSAQAIGRMSGALAARAADTEADKGRVAATKVHRYRAGQAPAWIDQVEGGEQGVDAAPKERTRTEGVAAPVIVKKNDDPRLRRLAQRNNESEDREEALQRRREIRAPEIVKRGSGGRHGHDDAEDVKKEEGEEEEEDVAPRRDSDRAAGRRHAEEEEQVEEDGGHAHGEAKSFLGGRTMQIPVEDEEEVLRKRQAVRER